MSLLPESDWLDTRGPRSAPEAPPHLRPALASPARKRSMSPLAGAVVSVVVILVTLVAQLGLSIAVSEGAYEARALQLELRDLTRVERVLSQNAAKLASPQNLAANAAQLGMVQNSTPATLRLSDGAVLGNLGGPTADVATSTVANATLEGLPMIDANGLLIERTSDEAEATAPTGAAAPVRWEGALPAPHTH